MSKKRDIYLTEFDKKRLKQLIYEEGHSNHKGSRYVKDLETEINRATVVKPEDIPDTVITMNSTVKMTNIDTKEEMKYTLVFPRDADIDKQKISIKSPVGTAILGYSIGDIVEWPIPSGICHIKIEDIIYQPEKAGDFDL